MYPISIVLDRVRDRPANFSMLVARERRPFLAQTVCYIASTRYPIERARYVLRVIRRQKLAQYFSDHLGNRQSMVEGRGIIVTHHLPFGFGPGGCRSHLNDAGTIHVLPNI
jgi:hypothetical protein